MAESNMNLEEALAAWDMLCADITTYRLVNEPAVAAGQPPVKPWILTAARFDNLLNVYHVLYPRGVSAWINQRPTFILFLLQYNYATNGGVLGVPMHSVQFFNRTISSREADYLFNRITQEVAQPGSTGTATCSDVFAPLDDAHSYAIIRMRSACPESTASSG
ncbi:hypothetical protein HBI56_225320 [Parastagonospora nodorum]|uniref:Uncharacterized protein n=2 Tax=Phaeosphaeria nodorum (strain SN15 / ATCC MYA-4574 / FGSC 10173) TaxID=321614 RepID=A0A7U2ID53_PHANO|nr:hypothetical protein SNOG_16308 [Parastagonospora nodorum SN15]KAH3904086.1 hypothetical protein HBH56_238940 [Parastagonospora nodorum]EAT76294.1 hypothetical protein SNOG_16308 [Parastagonospora nodorum SN15]KAH3921578.1 hypothetical protein HBH54_237100 [Parastagonospora nodorum]KAH3939793.1 hypothetical protein HBH53_229020 [Parastagonospora nodorum]KAH3957882.1 hypothetical protein HBH51_217570 [Parastagonospora nodorum]